MSNRHASLSPTETAIFLAAKAIAGSTSFLDGRSHAAALAMASDELSGEILAVANDPDCNMIVDPVRILVLAMMHAAIATGPRQMRWRCIMVALVDLVRTEVAAVREQRGAQL